MKVKKMIETIKINTIFSPTNGFFTSLYTETYDDYVELFGDIEPTILDTYFYNEYGERYITPLVRNTQPNMWLLTHIIYSMYVAKWLKIKSALDARYDVSKPYDMHRTYQSDRDYTSDSESTRDSVNKVYGFNDSVDGHNDDSNETSSTRNVTNTDSTARSESRYGVNGNVLMPNLIFAELSLREYRLLDMVINDIKNECCLSIYG